MQLRLISTQLLFYNIWYVCQQIITPSESNLFAAQQIPSLSHNICFKSDFFIHQMELISDLLWRYQCVCYFARKSVFLAQQMALIIIIVLCGHWTFYQEKKCLNLCCVLVRSLVALNVQKAISQAAFLWFKQHCIHIFFFENKKFSTCSFFIEIIRYCHRIKQSDLSASPL